MKPAPPVNTIRFAWGLTWFPCACVKGALDYQEEVAAAKAVCGNCGSQVIQPEYSWLWNWPLAGSVPRTPSPSYWVRRHPRHAETSGHPEPCLPPCCGCCTVSAIQE